MSDDQKAGFMGTLSPLAPLLNVPPEVLGKGEPLEWVIRVWLATALTLSSHLGPNKDITKWGQLFSGVFRSTMLKDLVIQINTQGTVVRALPKFIKASDTRNTVDDRMKADPWHTTLPVNAWPLACDQLLPVGTIGYPAPQSQSPDLIVRVHSDVIVGFAAKLNKKSNPITQAILQKEIDNAQFLLSTPGCKKVCLVLVAMHLGAELMDAFHDTSKTTLVLKSGEYVLKEGKFVHTSTPSQVVDLNVPENMEVVVLGEGGLDLFLGMSCVESLKKLMVDRLDGKAISAETLSAAFPLVRYGTPK
jgi:hypothetical protein